MKDYFTTDIRARDFDSTQYQMLSDLIAAEVEKASLPGKIKDNIKKLKGAEADANTSSAPTPTPKPRTRSRRW